MSHYDNSCIHCSKAITDVKTVCADCKRQFKTESKRQDRLYNQARKEYDRP